MFLSTAINVEPGQHKQIINRLGLSVSAEWRSVRTLNTVRWSYEKGNKTFPSHAVGLFTSVFGFLPLCVMCLPM